MKHYSHGERPPLLPQQMADVYAAIAELLGETGTNILFHRLSFSFNAVAEYGNGVNLDLELITLSMKSQD